jgi:molybdopterin-guanine dinucleotide biosynthesis protein A
MKEDISQKIYPDVTGVLLAGGKSRRMGRDKAALVVAGKTMADRMLEWLQSHFPQTLIAGDRPDLARPGIACHPDIYTGSSLGGLHNGLLHAPTEWIFAVACDMPFPDTRLLVPMLNQRDRASAVVLQTEDGFEPLFALYHKSCLSHLERLLQEQKFRIQGFFDLISFTALDPSHYIEDWQKALSNLNTPEDLQRVAQEQG